MQSINSVTNYIPPKTLGEGLARVKKAIGCGEMIKNANGYRLYRGQKGGTIKMSHAVLDNKGAYAGTAIFIHKSSTCVNPRVEVGEPIKFIRTKLYSDAVKDAKTGLETKPIYAVTDFAVVKSPEGKPVVKYGLGKNAGNDKLPASMKEIKSENVPKAFVIDNPQPRKDSKIGLKEYSGKHAPDGDITYYLKDTFNDGERNIVMPMSEHGIKVPILQYIPIQK